MGSRVYGITAVHWCTRNHNGFTGLHWFTLVTLFTPLHGLRLGVYGFTHVHLLHIVHMVYITSPPSQPMGSRVYGIKALHWFTRNHNGFTGLHWFTWFTLLTPLHSLRLGVYGFTHVHLLHTVHMVYIIPPLLPTPGFTGLPDYGFTLARTESHGFAWSDIAHTVHMVSIPNMIDRVHMVYTGNTTTHSLLKSAGTTLLVTSAA